MGQKGGQKVVKKGLGRVRPDPQNPKSSLKTRFFVKNAFFGFYVFGFMHFGVYEENAF